LQSGFTPLHYAAAVGNTPAVRALLAAGALTATPELVRGSVHR
jgi:ankyrin repeat protein